LNDGWRKVERLAAGASSRTPTKIETKTYLQTKKIELWKQKI